MLGEAPAASPWRCGKLGGWCLGCLLLETVNFRHHPMHALPSLPVRASRRCREDHARLEAQKARRGGVGKYQRAVERAHSFACRESRRKKTGLWALLTCVCSPCPPVQTQLVNYLNLYPLGRGQGLGPSTPLSLHPFSPRHHSIPLKGADEPAASEPSLAEAAQGGGRGEQVHEERSPVRARRCRRCKRRHKVSLLKDWEGWDGDWGLGVVSLGR
jgi:hypothetical protein